MGRQDVLVRPVGIQHGRQINASNTGINFAGLTSGDLTPVTGFVTYSTNGQVITGKAFDHTVDVDGDDITIRNSVLTYGGASGNAIGFQLNGARAHLENCLITAPAGQSLYEPVLVLGASSVLTRLDISRGQNTITIHGEDTLLEYCYGHGTSLDSNLADHADVIELYGGSLTANYCNFNEGTFLDDAIINVAPFNAGAPNIDHCILQSCLLGPGGQEIILLDNQAGGFIHNVQVLDNDMDQGTNPDTVGSFGVNRALASESGHAIVETLAEQQADPTAIWWPTSGVNANRWVNATGVVPDWTGLIVVPPQSHA